MYRTFGGAKKQIWSYRLWHFLTGLITSVMVDVLYTGRNFVVPDLHQCTWPTLCGLIGRLCLKLSGTRNLHRIGLELSSIRCQFLLQLAWACQLSPLLVSRLKSWMQLITSFWSHEQHLALIFWHGFITSTDNSFQLAFFHCVHSFKHRMNYTPDRVAKLTGLAYNTRLYITPHAAHFIKHMQFDRGHLLSSLFPALSGLTAQCPTITLLDCPLIRP